MKCVNNKGHKKKSKFEHGGKYAVGKKKCARPLDTTKVTHLVLKSERAFNMGVSFTRHRNLVEKIIRLQSHRAKVRIYSLAIVGNHIHLAIYFKERTHYVGFVRAVTGHLILALSKVLKKSLKGMFDLLPYSRIVEWGKGYKRLLNYIAINDLESRGNVFSDRNIWVLGKLTLLSSPIINQQLAFLCAADLR